MVSSLTSDGTKTNGRDYKVESQALLDTCLADVFVVSTKERFVRPVGSLNRAKRSPGLRYTAVSYQSQSSHHTPLTQKFINKIFLSIPGRDRH